jgi:hypothetical protein
MATASAVLLTATVFLFAACGGGGGEATPPAASPTQAATPGGSSTPAALPTVDPDVPLVEYHSADKGYSLQYPQGWEVDASPGSPTDFFFWRVRDRRLAQLQVTCNRQVSTVDSLMLLDADFASNFGGNLDWAAAVPVEIAGVEGKRNRYSISVSGITVEHVVAYVVAGGCGWRIGLNTQGPGTLEPYLPLFDRILASVRFD